MGKRKPLDKAQVRERRNRLLASAGAAELSLTEGIREMRAIAGMTQEEFARHRGVSARVVKALELGQGNPTVATLNRIGQFFGLEVAFVPIRRTATADAQIQPKESAISPSTVVLTMTAEVFQNTMQVLQEHIEANTRLLSETVAKLNISDDTESRPGSIMAETDLSSENAATGKAAPSKKKKQHLR